MRAIYGQKLIMSRIFDEAGRAIPVTLVKILDNTVSQVKTPEKDGYSAIQIGVGSRRKLNKPQIGHLKNLDIKPLKLFEIKDSKTLEVGSKISGDDFAEGENVNVTAISKGKGFAGTVKRHHFHLGPKTHGSNNYRQPGSIGSMYPQRVIKGRRMAGHLGHDKVTTKNLQIVKINNDNKQWLIKGAIPGPSRGGVLIWSKVPRKVENEA